MPQAKRGHKGPFVLQNDMRPGTYIERFEPDQHRNAVMARLTLNRLPSAEDWAELPTRVHVPRKPTETRTFIYAMNVGPFILPPVARDILAALEPGAHVFHELEAFCDGVSLGRHFLLAHAPALDCVDIDETIFRDGQGGREYYEETMARPHGPAGPGSKPHVSISHARLIVLKAAVIAGHHWWRPTDNFGTADFCSLALKQAYKEAGIAGLQYTPCKASGRLLPI